MSAAGALLGLTPRDAGLDGPAWPFHQVAAVAMLINVLRQLEVGASPLDPTVPVRSHGPQRWPGAHPEDEPWLGLLMCSQSPSTLPGDGDRGRRVLQGLGWGWLDITRGSIPQGWEAQSCLC